MTLSKILKNVILNANSKSSERATSKNLDVDILLAFTCDLEISPECRSSLNPKKDERFINGYRLLEDLLSKYELNGTFFTQGQLCLEYPEFVSKLHKAGHEIGSHGFDHIPMTKFWSPNKSHLINFSTLDKRTVDIRQSVVAIKSVIGRQPVSFRAPHLAIDDQVLSILENEGFLIDSSIYNPAFGRNSYPYHPSEDDIAATGHLKLLEIPVTVSSLTQRKLVYYRYPLVFELEKEQIGNIIPDLTNQSKIYGHPFAVLVTYIHPYELCDPIMYSKVLALLASAKKHCVRSVTFSQIKKEYDTQKGKNHS